MKSALGARFAEGLSRPELASLSLSSDLPPERLTKEFVHVSTRILSIIDRKLSRKAQPEVVGNGEAPSNNILFYKMWVSEGHESKFAL